MTNVGLSTCVYILELAYIFSYKHKNGESVRILLNFNIVLYLILALIYFWLRPIFITILVSELGGPKTHNGILKCDWLILEGQNLLISGWLRIGWFWRAKFHSDLKWLTLISPQFKFILEYYTVHFNKKYGTFVFKRKEIL